MNIKYCIIGEINFVLRDNQVFWEGTELINEVEMTSVACESWYYLWLTKVSLNNSKYIRNHVIVESNIHKTEISKSENVKASFFSEIQFSLWRNQVTVSDHQRFCVRLILNYLSL